MTDEEHQRRLENHSAWLVTSDALFDAAELIWPHVQAGFDESDRILKSERELEDRLSDDEQWIMQPAAPTVPLPLRLKFRGFGNAYLLNAGYAVENLLKAIRVKRLRLAGKPIKLGKKGSDDIPTKHIYEQMAWAELGDTNVTDDEVELLKRLSQFVRWAGRYPVGKPSDVETTPSGVRPDDRERVRSFQQKLIAAYKALGT
jgi:hypothetical protein